MLYEVFIPSTESEGYDVTITVEAKNWMSALRSGLDRTGENDTDIRGVMCDIKEDNSIHVTDAMTRRVFVLRELDPEFDAAAPAPPLEEDQPIQGPPSEPAQEEAPAETTPEEVPKEDRPETPSTSAATVKLEAVEAPAVPAVQTIESAPVVEKPPAIPVNSSKTVDPSEHVSEPSVVVDGLDTVSDPMEEFRSGEVPIPAAGKARNFVDDDGFVRIGSSNYKALREQTGDEVKVVSETRQKSGSMEAVPYKRPEAITVSENILEDIFLEIQAIHEDNMAMEDVVNFVMDMAIEKVPCESGAVLFADVNGLELYFATARGPKAKEVMTYRVPMGQGIVGFCAREGVSLAISDAEKDPRFHKSISTALSYPVNTVVCVPIQYEGRVYGCLELLNKNDASVFSSNEVNALNYIGNQFAQYINRLIMAREKI